MKASRLALAFGLALVSATALADAPDRNPACPAAPGARTVAACRMATAHRALEWRTNRRVTRASGAQNLSAR